MSNKINCFYYNAFKCPYVKKVVEECPFLKTQVENCPFLTEISHKDTLVSNVEEPECDDLNKCCCYDYLKKLESSLNNEHESHQHSPSAKKEDELPHKLPPITTSVNESGFLIPDMPNIAKPEVKDVSEPSNFYTYGRKKDVS